jgi:purine-binding chemotaxis protein CheW
MSNDSVNTAVTDAKRDAGGRLAGKYLAFSLMDEEYALEILKVREIFRMFDVTSLSITPPYMLGLINLRSRVIPIVDLRRKLDLGIHERTEHSCIIVCGIRGRNVGIVVDRINEVADIGGDEIDVTPLPGAGARDEFLLGIGKSEDRVRMLLDIEKVFSSDDLDEINSAVASSEECVVS